MCDTLGKIISDKYAIFGKNSDRAVNEPQVVEYYPAKDYLDDTDLKCTYLTIKQARHTNAIVLSRPIWLWGGEMGVNEYGLCIGNEAVFTKGKYGKQALIGMDLLRLALERSDSAYKAIKVIIALLEEYGQGGNCGYDKKFEYNNSFLIMDRKEIYVLETVGQKYVYKKYDHASISNRLSIHNDGDYYSDGVIDFAHKYSDLIMTYGSHGKERKECSYNSKLDNLQDMFSLLRSHHKNAKPFIKGTVNSICMHASNSLTNDETTMSMVVELKEDNIIIWLTGCSLPCISLYKPVLFKINGLIGDYDYNLEYWYKHELFNRQFLASENNLTYQKDLEETQNQILDLCQEGINDDIVTKAMLIDEKFFNKYLHMKFKKISSTFIFNNFWHHKNIILEKEYKERINHE